MIDKRMGSISETLQGLLQDGSTLMVGGFGDAGVPFELLHGILDAGARNLTIISNNAGTGNRGISALLNAGRVKKIICSYPRSRGAIVIDRIFKANEIELEVIPQGTPIERIRCAGAGLGGFYTPTGAGTPLAEGKEVRLINGREHLFEEPLRCDLSLLKADRADRWGNLVYSKAARNFSPIMATAAEHTLVQVREFVALGELHPESIVTPGIFVDRLVVIGEAS